MTRTSALLSAVVFTCAVPSSAFSQPLQVSVAVGGTTNTIMPGGSLALTATSVGQSVIANSTATISTVSVAGSSLMTLLSAPAFPVALNPGGATSFTVQYLPSTGGSVSAQVLIPFTEAGQASVFSFNLVGNTPDMVFSSLFPNNAASTTLSPGDRITFPTTNVGSSAAATIIILNRGSAAAGLQSAVVSNSDFIVSFPGPLQLLAGQQTSLTVVFTPHSVGSSTGSLSIGTTSGSVGFSLSGAGTSVSFTVSYTLPDGNVRPLANGTSIIFPSVDVNGTTTAGIDIQNQGTGNGSITNIALSGTGFRLGNLPLLPATVGPGQASHFSIVFAPPQIGSFSGAFRIDFNGSSISGTVSGTTGTPNVTVSYTLSDGNAVTFASGTPISFPSVDVNGTATANFDAFNQGTASATVTNITLTGVGFRISGLPAFPATIGVGQHFKFSIIFAPTQAGSFSANFRIDLSSASISGTLTGNTASANLTLAYIDSNNSTFALQDQSTLAFPDTLANATSTMTVLVGNTGRGTGTINSIALTGTDAASFLLLGLPTIPASVGPNQQVRFALRFSPSQQQMFSAALVVDLNGQTVTAKLKAQGTGPQFTYSWSNSAAATTISPGDTVGMPDTNVGETSRVTITIANIGTADGAVSSIAVTGQGFSLEDVSALPISLKQKGAPARFTLKFAPTQAGAVTGRLTIGSDSFALTATALGAKLIYTYINAASTVPVLEGGTVIVAPVPVGNSASLDFSVQNTGTTAASLSSINLPTATTVFTIQKVPSLPTSLAAGASITFSIAFTPSAVGGTTATLRVNDVAFTLSGAGTPPDPLPTYDFQGPSGLQQPSQQPTVSLSLSAPYPLDLRGTMTLTFVPSAIVDDPAIQFASGGRTAKFTIPANTTRALFANNATSMPFQTGTVTGNIVITPAFTLTGGFDLTPSSPAALTMTISASAPQVSTASTMSQTLNSFTILINGYSTTRAVNRLDIQITPKAGVALTTTDLALDVSSASAAWFQSTLSQQSFGGMFSISIPLTLQGGSNSDLVHKIQSLSIRVTSPAGTSAPVSIGIQ
jgi:hypothetical protein